MFGVEKALFLNFKRFKKFRLGYCPICERLTIFYSENEWLRDHYFCLFCESIPRYRAIIKCIKLYYPQYKNMTIHESSPAGAASDFLKKKCEYYSASHYFPEVPIGQIKDGFRCENLEALTFDNETFDLFLTQDVFEHIMNPDLAFMEINRVLKPGGAHIFTVPLYPSQKSLPRAIEKNGEIIYLKEPAYHGNPINDKGSLVTYDWGNDIVDYIYKATGMMTNVCDFSNANNGIEAKFIEVFVSRKKDNLGL